VASDRAERVAGLRVVPGHPVHLLARDTDGRSTSIDKDRARDETGRIITELDGLHNRLWAEGRRSVLLILQGMDSSGKDGTIRRVLSGLNPQGCQVHGFKVPTSLELAHDYLWRVHAACPDRGRLGVFNRSHYEDVVAARMFGSVDREQCRRRYRHIREFERMLTDEGTALVKVFLHISKDEQRRRLQERLDDPTKNWKFRPDDLVARAEWDHFMETYEEALTETSTDWAPWHVVPADRKWARDLMVAQLLVHTFRRLDPQIPPADPALRGMEVL
jgi:PPK2 family polyphosphate:nucleotide phosphotransferase